VSIIIISGTIDFPPDKVMPALEAGRPLIDGAYTEDGCMDYDWCPDPRVPGRVRVFERWRDAECLAAHFKSRWYNDMRMTLAQYGILGADVLKYSVDCAEPVYDETGTARADFFTRGK
jgi:quinol monooxygenase YgiN